LTFQRRNQNSLIELLDSQAFQCLLFSELGLYSFEG
jgi:hypothetical protein